MQTKLAAIRRRPKGRSQILGDTIQKAEDFLCNLPGDWNGLLELQVEALNMGADEDLLGLEEQEDLADPQAVERTHLAYVECLHRARYMSFPGALTR